MASYIFDIETNGLLDTLTQVHCIVLEDAASGEVFEFGPGMIPAGIALMQRADLLVGHNILKFDIPAINQVYPNSLPFGIDDLHRYRDTLVLTRMLFPEMKVADKLRRSKPGGHTYPGKLVGSHKLEAWGYRLGLMKGEYGKDEQGNPIPGCWDNWNAEMQAYCVQDVKVTRALYALIQKRAPVSLAEPWKYDGTAPGSVQLEHEFAYVLAQQEQRGIAFNEKGAVDLYTTLVGQRQAMTRKLQDVFKPEVIETVFVPKVNNKKQGYVKGVPFTKRKTIEFNPSSRQQVARRLKALGWEPTEFTDGGEPKIDETILSSLPWTEARVLSEYFTIEKRIGQIAEGDQAWLKVVRNGRIHGSVNPCGTPTARCTHSNPNVTQVPKVGKPLGLECRSLFMASSGMVLVGADLSGIELRCLAHFMSRYDDGLYAKLLLEGDVHWANVNAMALCKGERDKHSQFHTIVRESGAKRFIYAFLYGCGDEKAGSIIHDLILDLRAAAERQQVSGLLVDDLATAFFGTTDLPTSAQMKKAGKKLKASFLNKTPALRRLREVVIEKAKKDGSLKGLDGRRLRVRSAHSALNTLLQAAGALIAKLATVLSYRNLLAAGLVYGRDFAQVIHAHDELQVECLPKHGDTVGKIIVASMTQAGVLFNLRLPIAGEYKIGNTWADTH